MIPLAAFGGVVGLLILIILVLFLLGLAARGRW